MTHQCKGNGCVAIIPIRWGDLCSCCFYEGMNPQEFAAWLRARREAAVKSDLTTARRPLESPRSQTTSCTTQPFQTRRKPNLESPSVCLVARSTGFSFERRIRHAGRDIIRLCRPRMAGAWQGARKDRLNLTGFVSAGKTTGFLSRGPWFYFSSFFFCWRCPRLVFGGALPLSLFSFSF